MISYSKEEVEKLINELMNELLDPNYFDNLFNKLNDLSCYSFDNLLLALILDKLDIKYNSYNISEKFEEIESLNIYDLDEDERLDLIYENYYNYISEICLNNREKLLELINKKYDIKCATEYEINNISCLNIDDIKTLIDKGIYNIVEAIPDILFLELDGKYITKLLDNGETKILREQQKFEHVLKYYDLIKLLKKISNQFDIENIYSKIDIIDKNTFDILLKEKLYDGIENCKYVCSNEEYVEKLIGEGYYKIILYLSEEQFIEPLLSIIISNIDNALYNYFSNDKIELLKSDKIYNLFYNNCNKSISYARLLEGIPSKSLTEKRRIECLLNVGYSYHIIDDEINKVITNEDIKYAIENGYKYSSKTILKNNEEVKAFIDNGQYEAIEVYTENNTLDFDRNIVLEAIINGYKPSDKLCEKIKYQIPNLVFRSYVENGNYALTTLFIKIYNPDTIPVNIIKGTLASPYKKELCDLALTNKKLFNELYNYNVNNYDVYNYENELAIQNYIQFKKNNSYDNIINLMKSKEDIYKYFDEKGPSEKLYKEAFFDKNLFDAIYFGEYEKRYEYDDNTKQYISFIKLCDYIPSIFKQIGDIYKYFDSDGPSDALLDLALFDNILFKTFYVKFVSMNNSMDDYAFGFDKIFEYMKKYPSKGQYIKVVVSQELYEKHTNFISFISEIEDIDKYFDNNGPKRELYEKSLFDEALFNLFYKDSSYKERVTFDETINEYITLCNKIGMFNLKKYIHDTKLLYDYIDNKGPKQKLYEEALIHDKALFDVLFNDEKYLNNYNGTPSIKRYIEFVKKYGLIFDCWVRDIDDINNYFDENGVNEKFKNMILLNTDLTSNVLINYSHNQEILENIDYDLLALFEYYLKDKYFSHLDSKTIISKYKYLITKLGPKILFEFDNNKIRDLIDIDIDKLDKIFNLINSCKYDILPYNVLYQNIIISILNDEFSNKFPDIVNIFSNINYYIVNSSLDDLKKYIDSGTIIDENIIRLHQWVYDISQTLQLNEEEKQNLYNSIIECKNLNENRLRKYCRKYLETKEKKYREYNKNSLLDRIKIDTVYEKNKAVKCLMEYYQENLTYQQFDQYRIKIIGNTNYLKQKENVFIDKINMTKKEYNIILSITEEKYNLIIKCIKERIKPYDEIKNEYKLFKRYLNTFATYIYDNDLFSGNNDIFNGVNRTIKLDKLNSIGIMKELNIDIIDKEILSNDEIYNSLKKLFEVYCIGRLPEDLRYYFENTLKVVLPGGINNIGQFINSYSQILKDKKRLLSGRGVTIDKLDEIHLFFMEVIKYISSKNSETKEVKNLLGTEEYYDFISDARENSSSYNRIDREFKMVKIVDYLYTLDKITIPSCDKLLTVNNKSINIIVGNRTNASNICHGERTGACMRVGGVGEGLFLKCLTDKNWFHIRFENPKTHQYVSRISGFRNGNTLYLNQLRKSIDAEYSDENLQQFIKIYAQEVIEETKNSDYPIENVFINNNYAMEGYYGQIYQFGEDIQKEYNLNDVKDLALCSRNMIWTDVKNNALLLATTPEGKKSSRGYVTLKNGPEAAVEYDCVRDKVYGIHDILNESDTRYVQVDINNLNDKIIRVNSMKEKLLGVDYMSIPTLDLENVIDGFACSDWYVYIDINLEIHCDYITEIYKNEKMIPYNNAAKAKEEMDCFIDLLKKNYNIKEEVKYAI